MAKGGVFIPNENSAWSLDWDVFFLRRILQELDILTHQQTFRPSQVAYFVSKYKAIRQSTWRTKIYRKVAFDYYHGDPSLSQEFKSLIKQLKRKKNYFNRIRVSHSGIETMLKDEGFEEQVFRIPIGIELDWFPLQTPESKAEIRNRLNIPQSAVVLGSFQKDGNGWGEGMEPKWIKGPDIFLKTVNAIKHQVSELYVLLTGPARGYVKSGLERIGIPYQHHYLTDYRQIGKYFHALDAYLITSREEGGPKAVLESMASGIPLISTPVGQGQDLIVQGLNGEMASSFDPEELANLILNVLSQNEKKRIRQAGRITAEQNTHSGQLKLWRDFFHPLLTDRKVCKI